MLIDPNDFAIAVIAVFALGILAGAFWSPLSDRQPRDAKGRFTKQ